MGKGLTEEELKALVAMEQRQSLGYTSSKLSAMRQKAEYYYLGLPIGDLTPPEIDGRSRVVSTDVRDTIEAMLPQLMVTFTGGDRVAEFEPQLPDDEKKADLATEYINYLFFKKNNGHAISYTWMKDALLQKNGIVKVWWDTRHEEKKEEYRALDEMELAQVMDDPEVEITEQKAYPDEEDAKQRQEAIQALTQQCEQFAQQGNQQAYAQCEQQIQAIQAKPAALLYDITCKRVKTAGKISIENVPPEEFLIARSAKNIQDAKFVGHRVQRTVSELKSMGYKNVDKLGNEDNNVSSSMERIERLSWNDENAYMSDDSLSSDPSQRRIWVTECYVRCDFDGDGISELRKVTVAGNELLDNEEVDFVPFVSITPVPLPHTFFGLSIADLAMESQKTKTSILRAQLDNMYLGVNGRYYAVEGQVNLDDLLTSRPGGIVRMKQPGMAGRLDQGQGNSAESAMLMEYMQQDLENRTGWSRQSMGNDASGIHTTATAANIVTNKADMRIDLIARHFAEGFTELFKFMLKLVCQYQDKAAMTKIAGEWVAIDPREWRNGFDVNINVGIGMGNKDQKVAHLTTIMMAQEKAFQVGVATPQNLYASGNELTKLLGFKGEGKFFSDPAKTPPPQRPDPEAQKAQAQMQVEQAKLQATMQLEQMRMQQEAQLDQMKRDHEMALEQAKMQMQAQVDTNRQQAEADQKTLQAQQQAELDALKMQHENERHAREMEFKSWAEQLKAKTSVVVAKINASKNEMGDDIEDEEMNEEAEAALGTPAKLNKTDALMQLVAIVGDAVSSLKEDVGGLHQGMAGMQEAITRPKTVIRGPDGRVKGVV